MIIFKWQGINKSGAHLHGERESLSVSLLRAELLDEGLTALTIWQKRRLGFNLRITVFKPRVAMQALCDLYRQLQSLLDAGVPLLKSLEIIHASCEDAALKHMLVKITAKISAGHTLAQALGLFPKQIDSLARHLIDAGEQSGTLSTMLGSLADHAERTHQLKSRLKAALIYPATVLSVALAVTCLMLITVIPRFQAMYANFGVQLPVYTQWVLGFTNLLRRYGGMGLLSCLVTGFLLIHLRQRSITMAKSWDAVLLKLPLVGRILRYAIWTRCLRTLGITLQAGLPLMEAMSAVARVSGNHHYQSAFEQCKQAVSHGELLSQSLAKTRLFAPRISHLIAIGEQSGKLDNMLASLADYYANRLDATLAKLSQLLEPAIMIILCIVVGGLITAMYLPIFRLGSLV